MTEFLLYLSAPVIFFLGFFILKELKKEKVQETRSGRGAWWHD